MHRPHEICRIYRMLDTLPAAWQARSAYVEYALEEYEESPLPPVERIALVVEELLDDDWGSLGRLNREDIVRALDHLQRLALE